MLLIGFTWIFVAIAAGILVRFLVPGPWEASGPLAIMVAAVGAFFGSVFASLAFTPPGRFEDPSSPAMIPGIVLSLVGGFGAFAAYAYSVRRQATTE
jgi:drug/metabolite transporter (DMT)-like permease